MLFTAARYRSVTVFNIEMQSMVASRNIDLDEDGSPSELVIYDLNTSPFSSTELSAGTYVSLRMIQADILHTDWVTDMAMCRTTQRLLVTASYDGMIKVWTIIGLACHIVGCI